VLVNYEFRAGSAFLPKRDDAARATVFAIDHDRKSANMVDRNEKSGRAFT
jgi:hypothetical protein